MFQRSYLQKLTKVMNEPKQFIQVLVGPRQIGKTTLISQLVKEIAIPYIFESADAVAASDRTWIELIWLNTRELLKEPGVNEYILVIDEIQKIDNWSEIVKRLWDDDMRNGLNLKVILLGSSRLLIQQGLTESLAGRFELTYLGHWSFTEMESAFGFTAEQYVWFGGYPGSAGLINDEERWKNYVSNALIETSISKDILMLTRVDKPALMKRLFELGCVYSGQILSFTKILGQLSDAGNTTTLSHYLQLLDTAGLLGGIEKFAADVIRKRSSSPKFQVHNNALVSAQRNEFFEEIKKQPAEWGRMVESSIGAHLLNSSFVEGYKVFYWRHRNDEVDFVLEKRGKVIGIEVKSTGLVTGTSGMDAFNKMYKPDKMLLVGAGGLPWQEFLKISPSSLF
ncbi:putative AAA+ superfamily ATPase [Pedobacter sp. W3I1]|uniref:ATP-binding protein n=1 Tax=Pedobacter sp. W3I1 TaxID=3042291 RepID=UPI00278B8796|nr:ATP-binding protein [Pedobacter sp. W3I1]MDQ0639099.1 putative AAA+ superfamily ATPase [Pedobacter sp. W3I1]